MTRKHFEAIAGAVLDTFRAHYKDVPRAVFVDMANNLTDKLSATNERFDRGRFIRACLGEE